MDNPWAGVPSTARAYINSENDADRETARRLCKKYGLDYTEMRAVILAEMRAYEARRLTRPAPAPMFGDTMTITCSNCDLPFDITTDDHLVACPWCGQATFSPGADEPPGDDDDAARHAAGWRAETRGTR